MNKKNDMTITEFRARWHLMSNQSLRQDEKRKVKNGIMDDMLSAMDSYSNNFFLEALDPRTTNLSLIKWFWFNHFNINRPTSIKQHFETSINPYIYGPFRNLVFNVTISPDMLKYLDNAENKAGNINENFARELLELHTLGVNGGYTQKDVTNLAHLLTGLGLRPIDQTLRDFNNKKLQSNEFFFDFSAHDQSPQKILGRNFTGNGLDRVANLVKFISCHPSSAKNLANKLCVYFHGVNVNQNLVKEVQKLFKDSNDLKNIYEVIGIKDLNILDKGSDFKDPLRYLISVGILLAGGRKYRDAAPFVEWIKNLGQPLWSYRTPNGYSIKAEDWNNSGQILNRFELANKIISTLPSLLEDNVKYSDLLESKLMKSFVKNLGSNSTYAFSSAKNNLEKLEVLICCPEIMFG
jgi:uncharacterized protein (DUF1800 family)